MQQSRRDLLAASATALATGLAGCNALGSGGAEDPTETTSATGTSPADSSTPETGGSAHTAVAAEWNAMRARLWDALSLGVAGDTGTGGAVAQQTFGRFEKASGEYGAHEMLEHTSEANYAEFEEALGELRTAGLQAGDLGRAREETNIASTQLAEAQQKLVGEPTARLLDLQLLGGTVQNAAFLAAAGDFDAARTTAENVLHRFEEAGVHDTLESADSEAYEAFEGAVESVVAAAENEDGQTVQTKANEAFQAAIDGSYTLAESEPIAGTGHIASLQTRGWDAAALASMGGPSAAFAHAAALTIYRARTHDAQWLAAHGETDRAATMAGDVFAHFEGARAHEALEEADGEAYEGFEGGLSDLQSAIENGNPPAIDDAVSSVDSNLVTGIDALAGTNAPLLEAAFFRARFADAYERYQLGQNDAAASITEGLFERFERNELDFHETVEATSEDLYAQFEEEHLSGLIDAFSNADDSAVETHYEGVQSTLVEFETTAGSTATVSGAEAGYMASRGFDAAVLDALDRDSRAEEIARDAFEHFESGAGGYHEALEDADESTYGAFETRLGGVSTAAGNGNDVYPVATKFNAEAVASIYAIIERTGGSHTDAAATVMQDVFAHFEEARVHELIEEADHNAYDTFEAQLDAYISALEEGGDVVGAAEAFARGSQYAQFALVDSVEKLPLDLNLAGTAGGESSSGEGGGESGLEGGPNVVEGVPDDVDHVVEMTAVAFDPAELTVSEGDTVAWKHTAGEAHSVTADQDAIPEGGAYWASGGFDSEAAATNGWEDGRGAVQSGQSFVHTFETTGTHEYYCIPHEAAGMSGNVVVE